MQGILRNKIVRSIQLGSYTDHPQLTQQLGQVKTDDFEFKAIDSTKKAQKELADEKIDAYMTVSVANEEVKGNSIAKIH